MTGNDPRMWGFSLLEMNTEPGCPSIGIFPVVSAMLEGQLPVLFSPPTPVGSLRMPTVSLAAQMVKDPPAMQETQV